MPGQVLEDDSSIANYDAGSGYLNITLLKTIPGEDFKDLDIVASLLAPSRAQEEEYHPSIEVLDNGCAGGVEVNDIDVEEEGLAELSPEQREIMEGTHRSF